MFELVDLKKKASIRLVEVREVINKYEVPLTMSGENGIEEVHDFNGLLNWSPWLSLTFLLR